MRQALTFYHLFGAALLVSSVAVIVLLVPPTSLWIIILLVGLISVSALYVTALFTTDKYTRVLTGAFVAALLSMNVAIGFNVLNTILLICFIIGLKLLLPKPHE